MGRRKTEKERKRKMKMSTTFAFGGSECSGGCNMLTQRTRAETLVAQRRDGRESMVAKSILITPDQLQCLSSPETFFTRDIKQLQLHRPKVSHTVDLVERSKILYRAVSSTNAVFIRTRSPLHTFWLTPASRLD